MEILIEIFCKNILEILIRNIRIFENEWVEVWYSTCRAPVEYLTESRYSTGSQYFANINKRRRQYLAPDPQYYYIPGANINKRRRQYYIKAISRPTQRGTLYIKILLLRKRIMIFASGFAYLIFCTRMGLYHMRNTAKLYHPRTVCHA